MAGVEEYRNACRVVVWKPEGSQQLLRPRCRGTMIFGGMQKNCVGVAWPGLGSSGLGGETPRC